MDAETVRVAERDAALERVRVLERDLKDARFMVAALVATAGGEVFIRYGLIQRIPPNPTIETEKGNDGIRLRALSDTGKEVDDG